PPSTLFPYTTLFRSPGSVSINDDMGRCYFSGELLCRNEVDYSVYRYHPAEDSSFDGYDTDCRICKHCRFFGGYSFLAVISCITRSGEHTSALQSRFD